MCGISGIINFNNLSVSEKDLNTMIKKMKHRGPDDEGIFIDKNIGLGFVRLSILDLSIDGHQPMFSDDGRYVIIYNGEVYNYLEIRKELSAKYKFNSNTDTEVVLAAYIEWGEKCLERFNGMFAFVIYDTKQGEIFGARDRYGQKPLYYYKDDDKFIFASEIKSILPFIKKEPNNQIIHDYVMFNRTDHTNNTFFKNVYKIQHGSLFRVSGKKTSFKKWYNLSERLNKSEKLSPKEYRDLFNDSLKLRLRSDVPVGVCLSGGIDSSSITSSLYYDFGLQEINTFSAIFGEDEPTDESRFIKEYGSIIKNMHYTHPDANTFFQDFEDFIVAHTEPCPDTGNYIQYKVMELAVDSVKVLLDGQGADEQLAGYHNFFSIYYIELLKKVKLYRLALENYQYFKKHKSLNTIKYFIYYLLPFKLQNKISKVLYPSINKAFFKGLDKKHEANKMLLSPKDLNDSLLSHFEYKLEHFFKWGDINSMAFSIELRAPFLDFRLVEATLSTSPDHKIYRGETKHILREALKDILPNRITKRKDKKGFSNPRDKWFKSQKFQDYIINLINSQSFKNRGVFNSEVAGVQYKKHLAGKIDCSKEIWKWINLELWYRKYID